MRSPDAVRFATTRWSLIAQTHGSHPDRAAALQALCSTYWQPLYAFLRRDGHDPHDSEDLVQGFVSDLLLRDDFVTADPKRGRFRTFLLAALKNFRSKRRDHDAAQKRGGGVTPLSLNLSNAESAYALEPAGGRTAEQVFERQWALATLRAAMTAVEQSQAAAGRADWFAELRGTLTGDGAAPYADIAARLGTTQGAVKAAAARLRRDFRTELDRVLADGLDGQDVSAERADLFAALSR